MADSNQGAFKIVSLVIARVVYFLTNAFVIMDIFAYDDGSLLFPTDDWGRGDALISLIIFGLISYATIRYAIKNGGSINTDYRVIGASVVFGILCCFPY